jgi:CYTH domain-containing protein
MALEIEYKFLVDKMEWEKLEKPEPSLIIQSYLINSEQMTVRIRIKGDKGYLTIKGKTVGVTREEFEYEIPIENAENIINRFSKKTIKKYRYAIPVDGHVWEVDVFENKLKGLILAEIELQSEDETFTRPKWITEDVSLDPNYYNAILIEKC